MAVARPAKKGTPSHSLLVVFYFTPILYVLDSYLLLLYTSRVTTRRGKRTCCVRNLLVDTKENTSCTFTGSKTASTNQPQSA